MFLGITLVMMICSCACAGMQSFGNFRVNVPSGWSGELQGSTLVIKSDNGNSSVAVAFAQSGGASLSDIVERLYAQMGGDNLQQDEDGDYVFSFTNRAGAESIALITGDEEYYLVVSITGYDDSIEDELDTIIDSLDYED